MLEPSIFILNAKGLSITGENKFLMWFLVQNLNFTWDGIENLEFR